MEPKTFVDMLMALVSAQNFSEAQRYEIIGRFNTAMLGGVKQAPQAVVQEETKPKGAVLIHKGFNCECSSCNQTPYIVIADVHEHMTTEDFSKCFKPILPEDTKLWADPYGNVAINCPLCRSNFTVWIKGKGEPYDTTPETQEQPLGNRLPGDANIWKE